MLIVTGTSSAVNREPRTRWAFARFTVDQAGQRAAIGADEGYALSDPEPVVRPFPEPAAHQSPGLPGIVERGLGKVSVDLHTMLARGQLDERIAAVTR